ncbi:hypothetical protein AX774_g5448 [Zancudomyces culisetae]|uniref:Uncharacterized protein n=1 Tax=Zancudomyces culisetae TaxID=1213189 RepID=A0A1R1PJJ6_ZANCU|nr:hypothetical protein AX774_g5448 [Zancudomyces culisetae]|eukprot:OMH81103.1 hypothetical protein AX774_g5448 [Zancudomyces culisetae]
MVSSNTCCCESFPSPLSLPSTIQPPPLPCILAARTPHCLLKNSLSYLHPANSCVPLNTPALSPAPILHSTDILPSYYYCCSCMDMHISPSTLTPGCTACTVYNCATPTLPPSLVLPRTLPALPSVTPPTTLLESPQVVLAPHIPASNRNISAPLSPHLLLYTPLLPL